MNDQTANVDRQRVEQLLECYGADPHAWPAHERSAALALLQDSADLRQRWEAARCFDTLLHAPIHTSVEPHRIPMSAVLARLPEQEKPGAVTAGRSRAALGGGLAAALALTLGLAYWLPSSVPLTDVDTQALAETEQWLWDNLINAEPAEANEDEADQADEVLSFIAMTGL